MAKWIRCVGCGKRVNRAKADADESGWCVAEAPDELEDEGMCPKCDHGG